MAQLQVRGRLPAGLWERRPTAPGRSILVFPLQLPTSSSSVGLRHAVRVVFCAGEPWRPTGGLGQARGPARVRAVSCPSQREARSGREPNRPWAGEASMVNNFSGPTPPRPPSLGVRPTATAGGRELGLAARPPARFSSLTGALEIRTEMKKKTKSVIDTDGH